IEVQGTAPGAVPRVLPSRGAILNALAFQPGGLTLAAAGDDGSVTLWDLAGAEPGASLPPHPRAVLGLSFDPDGRRLATASPDGRRLASVGEDRTLRVWDAGRGTAVLVLREIGILGGLAWQAHSGALAALGEDRSLLVESFRLIGSAVRL